jgi:hypothetical protein
MLLTTPISVIIIANSKYNSTQIRNTIQTMVEILIDIPLMNHITVVNNRLFLVMIRRMLLLNNNTNYKLGNNFKTNFTIKSKYNKMIISKMKLNLRLQIVIHYLIRHFLWDLRNNIYNNNKTLKIKEFNLMRDLISHGSLNQK